MTRSLYLAGEKWKENYRIPNTNKPSTSKRPSRLSLLEPLSLVPVPALSLCSRPHLGKFDIKLL